MTPKTIGIISEIRRSFYSGFSEAMTAPIKMTNGNASIGYLPIASWLDTTHKLNYICIYAHTAPDQLVPERPFILRIAINKGAGNLSWSSHRGKKNSAQSWNFELTLLPDEALAFLPWIVSLIQARDNHSLRVSMPPYPLMFDTPDIISSKSAWTQAADRQLSTQPPAHPVASALKLA